MVAVGRFLFYWNSHIIHRLLFVVKENLLIFEIVTVKGCNGICLADKDDLDTLAAAVKFVHELGDTDAFIQAGIHIFSNLAITSVGDSAPLFSLASGSRFYKIILPAPAPSGKALPPGVFRVFTSYCSLQIGLTVKTGYLT